jgi:hypothetical protein
MREPSAVQSVAAHTKDDDTSSRPVPAPAAVEASGESTSATTVRSAGSNAVGASAPAPTRVNL